MKVSVNMIVRDGDDFILPCLKAILPFVEQVLVHVDSRSQDQTKEVLYELQKNWSKLGIYFWPVRNPSVDLVAMRNDQLKRSTGDWIWIVDSDEYYLPSEIPKMWEEIEKLSITDGYQFFATRTMAPWTENLCHRASSNISALRIVRCSKNTQWLGKWGKERLNCKEELVNHLKYYYIHFTHWKKDTWRQEMNQLRIADARCLKPMPSAIIKELSILDQKYDILKKAKVLPDVPPLKV